ncbi:hypothetical protein BCU64_025760 [Vibrio lentus]
MLTKRALQALQSMVIAHASKPPTHWLTIKEVDTDNKEVTQTTTVAALGKWNATLDVSGLKDGTIAVTVSMYSTTWRRRQKKWNDIYVDAN